MTTVQFQLHTLLGAKSQREGRRVTLRTLANETKLSRHLVYAMADGSVKELPIAALVTVCRYLDCQPGDLMTLVDVDTPPDAN